MVKTHLVPPLKKAILLLNVIIMFCTTSASSWEGGAAKASQGALPENGFYVMTNSYQNNSKVTIVNLETGKTIDAYVQNNINAPAETVLVSPEAAEGLGIRNNVTGRVKIISPSELSMVKTQTSPAVRPGGDPDFDPKAAISLYGAGSIPEPRPAPEQPHQGPPPYSIIPDRSAATQDYGEVQAPNVIIAAPAPAEPAIIIMPAPAPIEAASESLPYSLGFATIQPDYLITRDFNEVQAPNAIITAPAPVEPAIIIMPAPALETTSEIIPYSLGFTAQPLIDDPIITYYEYPAVNPDNPVIASEFPDVSPAYPLLPERFGPVPVPLPEAAPYAVDSAVMPVTDMYDIPATQPDYPTAVAIAPEYPNVSPAYPSLPEHLSSIATPVPEATPYSADSAVTQPEAQVVTAIGPELPDVSSVYPLLPERFSSAAPPLPETAAYSADPAAQSVIDIHEFPAAQPEVPVTTAIAASDSPNVSSAYPQLSERLNSVPLPLPEVTARFADSAAQSLSDIPDASPVYPTQAERPVSAGMPSPETVAYPANPATQPDYYPAVTAIGPELPDVSPAYPSLPERFSSTVPPLPEAAGYSADPATQSVMNMQETPVARHDPVVMMPELPDTSPLYPALGERPLLPEMPSPETRPYHTDSLAPRSVIDMYEVPPAVAIAPDLPDVSSAYPMMPERFSSIATPVPETAGYSADPATQSVIDMHEVPIARPDPAVMMPELPDVSPVYSIMQAEQPVSQGIPSPEMTAYNTEGAVKTIVDMYEFQDQPEKIVYLVTKPVDVPEIVDVFYTQDPFLKAGLPAPYFIEEEAPSVVSGAAYPKDTHTLNTADLINSTLSWNDVSAELGPDASPVYPALGERPISPGMPSPEAIPYHTDFVAQPVIDMYEVPAATPEVPDVSSTYPLMSERVSSITPPVPEGTAVAIAPDLPDVLSAYPMISERLNSVVPPLPEAVGYTADPVVTTPDLPNVSPVYSALEERPVSPGMPSPETTVYNTEGAVKTIVDMYEFQDQPEKSVYPVTKPVDVPEIVDAFYTQDAFLKAGLPAPYFIEDDERVLRPFDKPEETRRVMPPYDLNPALENPRMLTDNNPDTGDIDTPSIAGGAVYPNDTHALSSAGLINPAFSWNDATAELGPDVPPVYSTYEDRPLSTRMPLPELAGYSADPAIQSVIDMQETPAARPYDPVQAAIGHEVMPPSPNSEISLENPAFFRNTLSGMEKPEPPYNTTLAPDNMPNPAFLWDNVSVELGHDDDSRAYSSLEDRPILAGMPLPESVLYTVEGASTQSSDSPDVSPVYPDPLTRAYSVEDSLYPGTESFDTPEIADVFYTQDHFLARLPAPYFDNGETPFDTPENEETRHITYPYDRNPILENPQLLTDNNADYRDVDTPSVVSGVTYPNDTRALDTAGLINPQYIGSDASGELAPDVSPVYSTQTEHSVSTRMPSPELAGYSAAQATQSVIDMYEFPATATITSEITPPSTNSEIPVERFIDDYPIMELAYLTLSDNKNTPVLEPEYHFNGPETTLPYITGAESAEIPVSTIESAYYNFDDYAVSPSYTIQQPANADLFTVYEPSFKADSREEIITSLQDDYAVSTSNTIIPPKSSYTIMTYEPRIDFHSASASDPVPSVLNSDNINTTEPVFYTQTVNISEVETAPAALYSGTSLEPLFYPHNPNTSDMIYPNTTQDIHLYDAYYANPSAMVSNVMMPQSSQDNVVSTDPSFHQTETGNTGSVPRSPSIILEPDTSPSIETRVVLEPELVPVPDPIASIIMERDTSLSYREKPYAAPLPLIETRVILENEQAPVPELKTEVIPEPEKRYFSDTVPRIKNLEKGKYYLQLGIYQKKDTELDRRISEIKTQHYPLVIQADAHDNTGLKLMVGPMNEGESNAVLLRFRRNGYKDAFIQHNGG